LITREAVIGAYLTSASKYVLEETIWAGSETAQIDVEVAILNA
jgi:hypothetical protein